MDFTIKKPHRVQIYEWKKGKVLPKPKTIAEIKDPSLKEELALLAIKKYLPYVNKKTKLIEAWKEVKNDGQ